MERKTIEPPKGAANAQERLLQKMYISNVAKRLRELNQPSDNDRRRWVWELIQNAKDTIANNPKRDSIDIKIVIDGDTVKFIHNGDPFTLDARFGLLWKYSEDKENKESTGRFGTGFLTTHCLSKIVQIQSDVYGDDGKPIGFDVTMFRDGQTEQELLEGLNKMKASERYYDVPYNNTTYTYHVNAESGRKAIKLGIECFHDNIAQTMLFCKELNSVVLVENGVETSIKRLPEKDLGNGLYLASFELVGSETRKRSFIYKSSEKHSEELSKKYKADRSIRIDAAIEVDDNNNIVDHRGKTSFFCSLPLVGIENQLEEPLIINSPDFEPDSERQSLILKGDIFNEETQTITEAGVNQLIYKGIMPLYGAIVSYLVSNGYGRLYLLASGLNAIKNKSSVDTDWYKTNVIDKYRSILLDNPVSISFSTNEKVRLDDCIIVKESKAADEETVFGLIENLYPNKLIKENHEWASILWKDGINLWSTEELCKDVEAKKNWNSLTLVGDVTLSSWYNEFLKHVNSYNELFLKEYALLPNLNGDLKKKDAEDFKQGEKLSEFVISLLQKMGKDVKPIILNSEITVVSLDSKYNSTSYSADLNKLASAIINDSEGNKLNRLEPLLSVTVDDDQKYTEEFINNRRDYFSIMNSLYLNGNAEATVDNNILKSAWEETDKWFCGQVLKTIEGYESIDKLPENLDVQWLNSALKALNVKTDVFNAHKVIPNQYGVFCKQETLYKDGGIPEELKNPILKEIGVDSKFILLDNNMDADAYAISKEKTTADIAQAIAKAMSKSDSSTIYTLDNVYYKYSKEALLEVACYLLTLLPNQTSKDLFAKQEKLLEIAEFLNPSKEFQVSTEIDYSDYDLWKNCDVFVSIMIMDAIQTAGSLEKLNSETGDKGEVNLVEKLNWFFSFINSERISDNSRSLYPNQNGIFKEMSSLYKEEGTINDMLKNIISKLVSSDDEYRNILMDTRIDVQPQQTLNTEDAYKLIDDTIADKYNLPKNWLDENFKEAIRDLIEVWGEQHTGTFNSDNFPKIYPQKDTIVLNVVWTKDKRQQAIDVSSKLGQDTVKAILESPGKIDCIKELAQSDDFEEIVRLGKVALEDKNRKDKDFEFKLKLGKYVENVLRNKIFNSLNGISIGKKISVVDNQNGQDLLVLFEEDPIFHIEVKSRWGNDLSVQMSPLQMLTARKNVDSYVLCCVDMSHASLSIESINEENYPTSEIINHTTALINIGELVQHIELGDPNDVHIGSEYKCVVPHSVISCCGCTFEEMISVIISKITKENL